MTRPKRLESLVSVRTAAGFLSVMLHLGLVALITYSGGRQDGVHDDDLPLTTLVMLDSRIGDQRDGNERILLQSPAPAAARPEPLDHEVVDPPALPLADLDLEPEVLQDAPPVEIEDPADATLANVVDPFATFVLPQAQTAALLQRIERLAQETADTPRATVKWNQDGTQYEAELVLEPASNGLELDRVVARISADEQGRQLRTQISLIRLPFSHFTQVIDRWDPMVQMHDDEIVGRVHINSRFNVLADSQARPRLLGKVSTAAGGFTMQSTGLRRESEVFRGGVETDAVRIALSEQMHAFEWARRDANARVHELADDTRIRFFADGSYRWRDRRAGTVQYGDASAGHPVYFIAARGVTVYVQGVVAGKMLVYSPHRIVVEGSLTYANDPRDDPDSGDYLGLVCDRTVVVAPPSITGPGDLDIHAAIYAKRRFVVTNIDHARPATLRLYGSLAAGSLTASEPRYATKLEYDRRFEQLRPPSFPFTNRYAAEDWDGRWTEAPERSAAEAF